MRGEVWAQKLGLHGRNRPLVTMVLHLTAEDVQVKNSVWSLSARSCVHTCPLNTSGVSESCPVVVFRLLKVSRRPMTTPSRVMGLLPNPAPQASIPLLLRKMSVRQLRNRWLIWPLSGSWKRLHSNVFT